MKTRPGYTVRLLEKKMVTRSVAVQNGQLKFNGRFTKAGILACAGEIYPEEVTKISFTTDSGEYILLANHRIPYIEPITGYRRYVFKTYQRLVYYCRSRQRDVAVRGVYSFNAIRELKIGEIIFQVEEYAFHKTRVGSVTNKWVIFPKNRPHSREGWRKHEDIAFAQGVKKENWPLLLECITGKYFSEINSEEKIIETIRKKSRKSILEKYRPRIDAVCGQCFDGSSLDEHEIEVGIGERLLFKGKKNGKPLFAVDSPNYGVALYLFEDYVSAKKWANQEISWQEAKRKAIKKIVHKKNWKKTTEMCCADY